MQDFVIITGMVIKTVPIGEYDRRVVILSKERGKISAFAKGARKPNSRLIAAASPFVFGQFRLYEGKSSYNIMEVEITNYFEEFREDIAGACYGMYFLEMVDYYTRENNDEKEMLRLLYQSLRALSAKSLDNRLVRYIFEIKALAVNGEFPGVPPGKSWDPAAIYTLDFIAASSMEKLYTFTVKEPVLFELGKMADYYRKKFVDREFKSLRILEDLL